MGKILNILQSVRSLSSDSVDLILEHIVFLAQGHNHLLLHSVGHRVAFVLAQSLHLGLELLMTLLNLRQALVSFFTLGLYRFIL